MNKSLIVRAGAGVRKHMGKAAKLLAVGLAMGTAQAQTTNTYTGVRDIFDGATSNFDYGFLLAIGCVGVVVAIGWLKYGARGAFGSKKA